MDEMDENHQALPLNELILMKMPFGKYKDHLIMDLPVSYLEWFARKGFPKGKLGQFLALALEIKANGLMHLLTPLQQGGHEKTE